MDVAYGFALYGTDWATVYTEVVVVSLTTSSVSVCTVSGNAGEVRATDMPSS